MPPRSILERNCNWPVKVTKHVLSRGTRLGNQRGFLLTARQLSYSILCREAKKSLLSQDSEVEKATWSHLFRYFCLRSRVPPSDRGHRLPFFYHIYQPPKPIPKSLSQFTNSYILENAIFKEQGHINTHRNRSPFCQHVVLANSLV
jgi:hypothetical protein